MNTHTKTSLLIMAAGMGSRYGGNKQIDRIGPDGEILLQYSVHDAIAAGFDKIVFLIKPEHRELLEEICSQMIKSDIEVCYAYQDFSSIPSFYTVPSQRTKPFGTVHAVLCARDVIKEPFAVINADDFYGADAFRVMHDSLVELSHPNALMVAYSLGKTLSPNGTVTRGICHTANDKLSAIKEVYNIGTAPDGSIFGDDGTPLAASLPVSMNMWGFTPQLFPLLSASFDKFLLGIAEGDLKAEYVISTFMDEQIKADTLSVSVLPTVAEWFGVTYREDRDKVADRLLQLKSLGIYPKGLII